MTTYIITREGEEKELKPVTLEVEETLRRRKHKRPITPARSLKVWNHSPTGFEFSYGGSGPAQLALAILLDFTNNKDLAVALHQKFKWQYIATLKHPGGQIHEETIRQFIAENTKAEM